MANQVYVNIGTGKRFSDSSGDYAITLQNLAAGAGRVSIQVDRSTGSQPKLHTVRAVIQWQGTTLADFAELYISTSDGTYQDGGLGTSDAAWSVSDKKPNLLFVGVVRRENTTANTDTIASFFDVPIATRYYSVAVWNGAAANAFTNTANVSRIYVTAQSDEIQ